MRYLISGYYGEGNLGDEAILAGILQEVMRNDAEAEFLVLSFSPDDTRKRHGVHALSTTLRDPAALHAAMSWADVLLSGGGSILHEADFELYGRHFLLREGRLRPIPYFLGIVLLAKAHGLPVMWYAQGLGPLHTRSARRLVETAGGLSDVVTFRDRDAALLAAEVGVGRSLVVPDPAYALAPASPEEVRRVIGANGVPEGSRFVAVCPRPWLGRSGYRDHLIGVVSRLAEVEDILVLFVAFQDRTDGPLCTELAADPRVAERARSITGVGCPALMAGILREARMSIIMRLHAGILSAAAGTPSVSIAYDPKVSSFARQTGQDDYTVSVDELETRAGEDALLAACLRTMGALPNRRTALQRAVAPLRREARATSRLAVALARRRAKRRRRLQ